MFLRMATKEKLALVFMRYRYPHTLPDIPYRFKHEHTKKTRSHTLKNTCNVYPIAHNTQTILRMDCFCNELLICITTKRKTLVTDMMIKRLTAKTLEKNNNEQAAIINTHGRLKQHLIRDDVYSSSQQRVCRSVEFFAWHYELFNAV